jgi:glycosyltransferase involved in cell wall biosynthesis
MVVHDVRPSGGMERVHREWLRRAAGEIDFTVISCTLPEELRGMVRWRRVPAIRRPIALKFLLFFVIAAVQVVRARADLVHTAGAIVPNRVDLISVHFCHAGFLRATGRIAAPAGSRLRSLNGALFGVVALLAERWCYRRGRVRTLAAVSTSVERQLAAAYPGLPVAVVPNGVDLAAFTPGSPHRASLRREQGVSDDDVVLLFVGGYWHLKGLTTAIAGLALAQPKVSKRLSLWVVGEGDEDAYRALARARGVDGQIHFFRHRRDIDRFYHAADLLVLPSLYESFSLVALEAAACGLPLVATRVGCIDELVGAGEAGRLVQRTPESVAVAIVELAEAPPLRAALGMRAAERAAAYTWERSVDSLLRLYRGLPAEHRLPRAAVPS